MLEPKRLKFRSQFRGRMRGTAHRGAEISFGDIGLKSMSCAWLTAAQIEACRRAIRGATKRGGKLWIRVFPHKPVSKKPPEVRMGSGKAPLDHYVAVVRPGTMLFELAGVDDETARRAFELAKDKLPIPTRIVTRNEGMQK